MTKNAETTKVIEMVSDIVARHIEDEALNNREVLDFLQVLVESLLYSGLALAVRMAKCGSILLWPIYESC